MPPFFFWLEVMTWRLRIHSETNLSGALLLTAERITIKADNGQSIWQQEPITQAQQQAGEVRTKQLPVFLMFASSFKSKWLVASQICHLPRIHCKEPKSFAGELAQALSSKGTFPKPAFSVLTISLYYGQTFFFCQIQDMMADSHMTANTKQIPSFSANHFYCNVLSGVWTTQHTIKQSRWYLKTFIRFCKVLSHQTLITSVHLC